MSTRVIKVAAPELRVDPTAIVERCDWQQVFGASGRVEVEIGIGKGRFFLTSAQQRPDVLHFGVEWANKYLRIAETRAVRMGLRNVRFARVDASQLITVIPPASVAAFFVFYPDPWPKKRHQKRRFLQGGNLDQLARTLGRGGCLHVATDHEDYWSVIEPGLDAHADFERLPSFGGDEFPLPTDGALTNFEAKYEREGRRRLRGSWRRRS